MINLHRQLLEEILFIDKDAKNVAVTIASEPDASLSLSREIFPETVDYHELPGGVLFLEKIKSLIEAEEPDTLFVFPPILDRRNIPDNLRKEYPRNNFSAIVLQQALALLKPESKLGILLPESFGKLKVLEKPREEILSKVSLDYYIEHDLSPSELGLVNIHSGFNFISMYMSKRKDKSKPTRFFKISQRVKNEVSDKEIIKDLRILRKQGGGQTHYGFVVRDRIKPGAKIGFDLMNPELHKRVEELSDLGEVRTLNDLFDIKRGTHISKNSDKLKEKPSEKSVPLLEPSCLKEDGKIAIDEIRYWVEEPKKELLLKENDICIRTIHTQSNNGLRPTRISSEIQKLVPSQHLIVLRPKSSLTEDDLNIIIEFLKSDLANKWLEANQAGIMVPPSTLRKLPIPFIDKNFRVAINGLMEAKETFNQWVQHGNTNIKSLFEIEYDSKRKVDLLQTGRLLRQRLKAAQEVDKLSYRIRNLFPHPIAYRWRKVEASKPEREGLKNILDCFEVLFVYLSVIAMISGRSIEGFRISKIEEIATRLSSNKKAGISLGDWIGLIRECNEKGIGNTNQEWIPFQEVFDFLNHSSSSEAVDHLKNLRNDEAHGRGPSSNEVETFYNKAKEELEILLSHVEFLTEHNLIYVESTKWDSFDKLNTYTYRNLTGDHPLVPLETGTSENNEIEQGSLYLQDRNGQLYLLRPYLIRRDCKVCGRSAIFYLDTYDEKSRVCNLKSLEEGHTVEDESITEIFYKFGMLK